MLLPGFTYYVFNDFNFNEKDNENNSYLEFVETANLESNYQLPILVFDYKFNNMQVDISKKMNDASANTFEYTNKIEQMLLSSANKLNKSQILLFNYLNDKTDTTFKILNKLRLDSKTIMQEKGVNSLFLAFVF